MSPKHTVPKDIDEYIAGFPHDVRVVLEKIRATIKRAAPGAEEAISYQIPTFRLKGNLVHFAAFKKHIGLYPAPTGTAQLQEELSAYKGAKASVRFPIDQPIPFALITKIAKARVKENLQRTEARGKRR